MSEITPPIHEPWIITVDGEEWHVDSCHVEYVQPFTVSSFMDLESLFGTRTAKWLQRHMPSGWEVNGAQVRDGTERMTLTLSIHRGPEWVKRGVPNE